MGLSNLREDVTSAIDTLKHGLSQNPYITTILGGGALLGAGLAGAKIIKSKRKKKSKSKAVRKKRSSSRSRRRRKTKTRRSPYTARKRKDTSTKRIRYTKRGQPYVIMRNGRARFISKRGAKKSHKMKGGRY